ncbi:MAG: response regulator [Bryobacteraceae bacterium]|nr:response regulator [Bryobacteraceae bacterium]
MSRLQSSPSSSAALVMLVDGNKSGLAARKSVLQEAGYAVKTSDSAETALELLARFQFQVVITDYQLPAMSGVDFIRELRARYTTLPVVLISGFADALGLHEANTGADIVIQKSANEITHLVRAVKRLLNRKPARKPIAAAAAAGASAGATRARR